MTSNILNFNFATAMQLYEKGTKKDHLDCKEYITKHIIQVLDTSTHVVFRDNKPIVLDNESFKCSYLDKFERDIQLWYRKRIDTVTLVNKPNQDVLVGTEVNIFVRDNHQDIVVHNATKETSIDLAMDPQQQINANKAKIIELQQQNELLLRTVKQEEKVSSPKLKQSSTAIIEGGGKITIGQLHSATKYKEDITERNVFKKQRAHNTEVYTENLGKQIFATFDNDLSKYLI